MRVKSPLWLFAIASGMTMFAQGVVAQTSIQLFSAVNVRNSTSTTTYANLSVFNSSTVNLTCSTAPIVATLSGPLMNGAGTAPQLDSSSQLQAGGNLLVDNVLLVTVTPTSTNVAGQTKNVCTGGVSASSYNGETISTSPVDLTQSCFTAGYGNVASGILGADTDTTIASGGSKTVDAVGGVAPIDISALFTSGTQNVTIGLGDGGGILASSSIFLTTNCTQGGVTGPATVTGNPITTGGTPQGLTQNFNFNTGNNQVVGFVYDVSGSNSENTLVANTSGAIPQTTDLPLDPATFQPSFVIGTSFATSNCLIHSGELLPNGNEACKLYTLVCSNDTDPNAAGALCPVSSVANEVVQDLFDGPGFSLPNIITKGDTFHEGIGFLMASEDWSAANGGPCTFDSASGLQALPCPQNLLTDFSGPGRFASSGETDNPNSTFISIYGVPEDLTSIYIPSEWPGQWSNSHTPKIYFSSEAPNFSKGAWVRSGNALVPLPGAANFRPAPIKSITYGVSPSSSPAQPVNEPIASDKTLVSTANCTAAPFTAKTVPNFVPAVQTLSSLPDGHYRLHYYAKDCAGTQELLFTQDSSQSWSTNFYSREINIDTTAPAISSITLSPTGSYHVGAVAYANFSCSDASTGAGVVLCGLNIYGTETTYATGTLKLRLNTLFTGTKTLVVYAIDGAGNIVSKSISYTVTR
jgi:hypothetical protein